MVVSIELRHQLPGYTPSSSSTTHQHVGIEVDMSNLTAMVYVYKRIRGAIEQIGALQEISMCVLRRGKFQLVQPLHAGLDNRLLG
jgi:hypothetical protein